MKISKNILTTASVSILAILVISATFGMLVPAQAQTVYENEYVNAGSIPLPDGVTPDITLDTYAHLSFRPTTIGKGQIFLVNIWLTPSTANFIHYSDYRVTITKPSGEQQTVTIDAYLGDATAWFEWIADEVGTWTINFDFPGGYFPAGNYTIEQPGRSATTEEEYSVYYKPSSDGPRELVVQEEIVYSWPEAELPSDYWTRPVHPSNREWWPILGNFPETGVVGDTSTIWPANTNTYTSDYDYVPYVQAPETAHIAWKKQGTTSGLVGGTMGQMSDYYIPFNNRPDIIYNGMAYQTVEKVLNGELTDVWQCYDIRTGETLWERKVEKTITGQSMFGPVYAYNPPIPTMITYTESTSEAGTSSTAFRMTMSVDLLYVGDGRYIKYDPFTGAATADVSIEPLSSGYLYADPFFLTVQSMGAGNYRLVNWTIVNNALVVFSNVTFPWNSLGDSYDFETMMAVKTTNIVKPGQNDDVIDTTIEVVNLLTGQIVWSKPAEVGIRIFSNSDTIADQGKVAIRFLDGTVRCWDLQTGNHLWTAEPTSWPWGSFGTYNCMSYGGMYIAPQYDCVHAIYWATGETAWTYTYETPFDFETPMTGAYGEGIYSFHSAGKVADGKVYIINSEHSAPQPITRGWKLHCIDAYTGDEVWSIISGQTGLSDRSRYFQGAIADGYLAISDAYTGYMYVYGKGQSETTVSAPQTSIAKGTSVMITGTVLDLSPAQEGTPCVSAASMATQMEYLHMQQPIAGVTGDKVLTGVPVTLTAIGTDGSCVDIGTTTTEGYYGTFGISWTPTTEGDYEIVASFAGDDSYGSSGAATYITVGPASSASSGIEQETSIISTEVAITLGVVAVAAIAAVAFLVLQKRK